MNDLRHALRSLRRSPGFTAAAVLTLALGIGVNIALFSVVKAVLLEPLPYGSPDRVAMIWSQWRDFDKTWVSIPEYHAYREGLRGFEDLALFQTFEANITEGEPERVATASVTPNLLDVLGVPAAAGRGFAPEEGIEGDSDVVLLSHGLWQARYGGDPGAVGSTLLVNGAPRTAVGVLPRGFRLPLDYTTRGPTQLLVPLVLPASTGVVPHGGGSHSYYAVGRLRDGVTAAMANAELAAHVRRLSDDGVYPPGWDFRAFAVTAPDEIVGAIRPALLVLLGAVALVLLIACANVTGLLLVRGESRRAAVAVRAALGAGRARLVRASLAESAALALAGSIIGLILAWLAVPAIAATAPAGLARVSDAAVDGRVLGFAVLIAVLASLMAGLVPALHGARIQPSAALSDGGRSNTVGRCRHTARRGIVVAQVALAVVLVAGAGLTLRSFWNLTRIDPGFEASKVLTMRLSANTAFYPDAPSVLGFQDELLRRVRAVPGVEGAGLIRLLPIDTDMGDTCIIVEGYTHPVGECAPAEWQAASPGYFEAMGQRVVHGRGFSDVDRPDAALAIIVNQEFARRYFDDGVALGRRVRFGFHPGILWHTIVGVVADARHNGLTGEIKPAFYRPHAQWQVPTGAALRSVSLVIRTAGDPRGLVTPVRDVVRSLDARVPLSRVQTMDEVLGAAVAQPRFTLQLLAAFAGLALLLAVIGVYGVVSYAVAARRRELGIRVALGAARRDVVGLALRQGIRPAALGVGLGLAGAVAGTRVLSGLLYDVATTDAATYAAVAVLCAGAALTACWLPARRAARIDPMEALRHE
jgi:putative ABC transport system permease protein